ncbi:MAG: FtsX-like permease family protein [Saprospiraceae bacterium]|nr:FtsX-like permease family protein [Saprospiraceae bacterium]
MKLPRFLLVFLEWICPPDLLEGIQGDLIEKFEKDSQIRGISAARRILFWNVLRLIHPAILLRNNWSFKWFNSGMVISHLMTTSRNMLRNKFYSFVNIFGQSLALAFVLLIFLFINHERSYDQFHKNRESIYRLFQDTRNKSSGQYGEKSAITSIPLAADLASEIPTITHYTRFASTSCNLRIDGIPHRETMHFVDQGFLQMFDFPLISGNTNTALAEPHSVIISHDKARKLFGDEDVIDKIIALDVNDTTIFIKISGLIDPKREKSSIPFDFLMPIESYRLAVSNQTFQSYRYGLVENYIQLKHGADRLSLERSLSSIMKKFLGENKEGRNFGLQSFSSLHFENEVVGNAVFVSPVKLRILFALGMLVLIIATINYVTLSAGQALNRVKEVAMRKTLGARKGQLTRQLILESFFISLLASGIAILISLLLLPVFTQLIGSTLVFSLGWRELVFIFTLIFMIAVAAGYLQSMILVRQNSSGLKRHLINNRTQRWFREGLIVFQFTTCLLLLIGALHIRAQMRFIANKDLGFDKDRILEIPLGNSPDQSSAKLLVDRFKARAQQEQNIQYVSASMNNAREPWTELVFDQVDGTKEKIYFNQVDEMYVRTMGIKMLDGSDFRAETSNASGAILVNEALVRHFNWQQPIGMSLPGKHFVKPPVIVGVVKDFHFSSLHQQIKPLILSLDPNSITPGITGLSTYVWPPNLYQLNVRIGPGEIEPVLNTLESIWKDIEPGHPFTFHFVDEAIEAQYAEEKRWEKVAGWASFFSLIIAWLGLVGVMRLAVQKRKKEIGIRRILGSTSGRVIALLSRRFLILICLSILIAVPVSWYLLTWWLSSFVYHIALNAAIFTVIAIGVLAFAMISIASQALQVMVNNPMQALKVE